MLPERYNEALLRKKDLTMKESNSVMKKMKYHLDQIKLLLTIDTNLFVKRRAFPNKFVAAGMACLI